MDRRAFLRNSATAGAWAASSPLQTSGETTQSPGFVLSTSPATVSRPLPDLAPARWIWYPSERCLQNTFVLFRRDVQLDAAPLRATGWIAADSRYLLEVNGRRIQWGPAPSDPRWPEADPLDLAAYLRAGANTIAVTVLFYGTGDGTWPVGLPGFLFWLEAETAGGGVKQLLVSDRGWNCCLARSWQPGHYKRWYLRALQEEFDARLYPHGWNQPGFVCDAHWRAAMELPGSPNQGSLNAGFSDYQTDMSAAGNQSEMRTRSIPLLSEANVPVKRLVEAAWLNWTVEPREYFECRTPDAFVFDRQQPASFTESEGPWTVRLPAAIAESPKGAALTFELAEQVVGWPYFTVEAQAGTVIELLVHEAHEPGGPVLLNSHFDSWTRFTCSEGVNRFETFDFESLRWLQLHVHGAEGTVKIRDVGVRRRSFPWAHSPNIKLSDPALQRLMDASLNTLVNSAQETCVDGMARERQQYSGDGAHQLHAIYYALGDSRLPRRFITTYSQGITQEGYFMDSWPAYDRLVRIAQRQLGLSPWGPILDHSVQFVFDCWYYYLYTGDTDGLREAFPRLLRFVSFLEKLRRADGLLPVEDLGVPVVWMDVDAFREQRHKQCSFNLYAAAMLEHALAPLCRLFDDSVNERTARRVGQSIRQAAVRHFWSEAHGAFVDNLPWLDKEGGIRCSDRTLAAAILFDQCPRDSIGAGVRMLSECPEVMGFSYPANAGWRLRALAKAGRADVVADDLRRRWATLPSVLLNNTLQEAWSSPPDSNAQWSHCAVVPLYVLFMSLAGIRPLEPGFKRMEIRPQFAGLGDIEMTAHTPGGPLDISAKGRKGGRTVVLKTPAECRAELVVSEKEALSLPPLDSRATPALRRYELPAGKEVTLVLKYS